MLPTMPWGTERIGGPSASESDFGLPAGFAEAFAQSMPPRYAVLFDPSAIRQHAMIALGRGSSMAHAEVWRTMPDGSAALCVVARDRPGLLSAIAATLVSHRLDVITALVFSRTSVGGEAEAVDLLWVRRTVAADRVPIGADEATSISEVLAAILAGRISVGDIASKAPPTEPSPEEDLVVRFEEQDEEGHGVLLVEATDRPALLLTITFEVYQQGAEIRRSLVRTAGRHVLNRFVLAEFGGAPLTPERREQIRTAVFSALAFGSDNPRDAIPAYRD
jgi:[protein-PII] uridylyltransferase